MARHEIDNSIPVYVSYFHALTAGDTTDILSTTAGDVQVTFDPNFEPYNIVKEMIEPLTTNSVLREDGGRLSVPLEGVLHLPTITTVPNFPLLMIAHGNHASYFGKTDESTEPEFNDKSELTKKGVRKIRFPGGQVRSYNGYEALQSDLAEKGIASWSFNLNIVNCLETNETNAFKKIALDANQRILFFFYHLKLLKMLSGQTLAITGTDPFPIKVRDSSTWVNLNATTNSELLAIKTAISGKIDFTRLGLMGHSRGADAVSRIPAYLFKGTTAGEPSFGTHTIVKDRIKELVKQVGSPTTDHIKSILALEPVAAVNDESAATHGYIIDDAQTMFFAATGTHDEDVSFDPVRIYEHPTCSKALIAINGASHQRFNERWAEDLDETKFDREAQLSLLSLDDHQNILVQVFGPCFTTTLGGLTADWDYFTRKKSFPVTMAKPFYIQMSWKFGFPIQTNAATLTLLDDKISGVEEKNPASSSFKFEQHLTAFFIEKSNEGNAVIKIPIDPATSSKLSNFSHFSFRFARGYDLSSKPERKEVKNFTIQFFDGNSPLGKLIAGNDISTLELKALRATPTQRKPKRNEKFKFEYSILLQTAEILLRDWCPESDLAKVNRIEITVIPDKTKEPPPSTGEIIFGSIGGAVIGSFAGATGGLVYALADDSDAETRDEVMTWTTVGCTALGGLVGYLVSRPDKNAFVFEDFLLTNRVLP